MPKGAAPTTMSGEEAARSRQCSPDISAESDAHIDHQEQGDGFRVIQRHDGQMRFHTLVGNDMKGRCHAYRLRIAMAAQTSGARGMGAIAP
jgi:hypothetical protein